MSEQPDVCPKKCPKCKVPLEMFTSDLDWCPKCQRQFLGASAEDKDLIIVQLRKELAQLRQQLAEAQRERDAYRSVLDSIHRGWDCDSDAHKYGTECRCCAAEEVLNEFKPKEPAQ